MKELPTYTPDFEEYIRQGEPDKKERAQIWRTAIGLQQVDGLETSEYLRDVARQHILSDAAVQIGKSERTVKTITVHLVEKGIIIRRNGKRNGYWGIVSSLP